jgi:hypothetical protein
VPALYQLKNDEHRVDLNAPTPTGMAWEVTIVAYAKSGACSQKIYRYKNQISFESNTSIELILNQETWEKGFYAAYGVGESLIEIFQFLYIDHYDLEISHSSTNNIEYGYVDLYAYYHLPDSELNPCMYKFEELWNSNSLIEFKIPITNDCQTVEELSVFDSYILLETENSGDVSHYLMWDNSLSSMCN